MNRLIITSSHKNSLLSTHKVLRNTYFLLSLTLAFSSFTATLSTLLQLPEPSLIIVFAGFYGLLFLTHRLANSAAGIFATFALTGFMGYTIGPVLSILLASGAGEVIMLALSGTALVFFLCSVYVLTTRKDMSFLSSTIMAGFVALLITIIANLFLHVSALSIVISIMFVLLSSSALLWEISNIIHGGETNYIRATVSLYVSLYNIFVSLLNVFGGIRNNHTSS